MAVILKRPVFVVGGQVSAGSGQVSAGNSIFTPPPYTDEYFNQVSLLLSGDGTSGAQNNTFLDASANGFTITRNGNTTQGSYSPYRSEWGVYFDASALSLSLDYTTAIHSFWDNNFTIEFWVNTTDSDTRTSLFSSWANANFGSGSYMITFKSSGEIELWNNQSSGTNQTPIMTGSTSVNDGDWHHIAITQIDNGSTKTFRLFVDGILDAYDTETSWTQSTANQLIYFGGQNAVSYQETLRRLTGYMSDFRLVKDIVYSTASTTVGTTVFTPPTEPLIAITNTEILALQSNRFIDKSINNYSLSSSGNGSVTPFSPYIPSANYDATTVGGSGYIDGTGDYLSIADDPALQLGSNDFTIEFWFYPTTSTVTGTFFSKRGTSSYGYVIVLIGATTNTLRFLAYDGAGGWDFDQTSTETINPFEWNHIATTRSGSNWYLWLNGNLVASATGSFSVGGDAGDALIIGNGYSNGTQQLSAGYMSDFRIVKGTALYTSGFTPPTAPLTSIANTELLCNFTNAGIYDATGKNVLETVNGAQIDTAIKKYGTGAIEFDGTGDYLQANSALLSSDSPFTFECWANWNDTGSSNDMGMLVSQYQFSQGGRMIFGSQSGSVVLRLNGTSIYLQSTTTILTGNWYHVAWSYDGTTHRLFINGNLEDSDTTAPAIFTGVNTSFGGQSDTLLSNFKLNGYMDDIRITKGVARYTANFTPPSAALTPYIEPQPTFDFLIVGGGGGGAYFANDHSGGGGGAGGLIYETSQPISVGTTYTVTVGNGGLGATSAQTNGANGGDSFFYGKTAFGGGGGGGAGVPEGGSPLSADGLDGGSGGGGTNENPAGVGGSALQPTSSSGGFGNDGGTGTATPDADSGAGGGGGAGGPGGDGVIDGDGTFDLGGVGGIGLQYSITGTATYYAGGGGGGGRSDLGGAGGLGGGGDGGTVSSRTGKNGTANTGGGGGGSFQNNNAGNGGSGVVIIRTLETATATTGSPTVTLDGSYNIYTFTSSGSITF